MPARMKTKEEYRAAAMLLNMDYDEVVNSFFIEMNGKLVEHDADTMKLLTEEEVINRIKGRVDLGVQSITMPPHNQG